MRGLDGVKGRWHGMRMVDCIKSLSVENCTRQDSGVAITRLSGLD